jgi:hypothetical protein
LGRGRGSDAIDVGVVSLGIGGGSARTSLRMSHLVVELRPTERQPSFAGGSRATEGRLNMSTLNEISLSQRVGRTKIPVVHRLGKYPRGGNGHAEEDRSTKHHPSWQIVGIMI